VKQIACPACGAPVLFRSGTSLVAVCGFCTSTLVRHGEEVENIGKMAALQDDPTRVQIGTEGVYRKVHFGVIGRIQLQYDAGLWNEWHLMFDDGNTGWLGEAQGEYFVTFKRDTGQLPGFYDLQPGQTHTINNQVFEVTDLQQGQCIAGQGELPFKVGPGYPANTADLRAGGAYATIDYSEDPPYFFIGEKVSFDELKLSNLLDGPAVAELTAKAAGVKSFECLHCGSPISLKNPKTQSVGCPSCGTVLDTASKELRIISAAKDAEARFPLTIPLGAKPVFGKTEWDVIGAIRRYAEFEGMKFPWVEYLLFDERSNSYQWLMENKGHWTLVDTPKNRPKATGTVARLDGTEYAHFESYQGKVDAVLGELYWRAKVGDTVMLADYIAPPMILSSEQNDREKTWSWGRYLTSDELMLAFAKSKEKPQLKAAAGIAPNQPSPYTGKTGQMWKWFFVFTAIAFSVQLLLWFVARPFHKEFVSFDKPNKESAVTSQPFLIKGNGNVTLTNNTNLQNNSSQFNYRLVNQNNGKVFEQYQEIAFFEGYEDGERWYEGKRDASVTFENVPAGKYVLMVQGMPAAAPSGASFSPVASNIEFRKNKPSWFNWFLMQALLAFFPLLFAWRAHSFEVERWADSDHPKSSSSSDDD
jgi:uncharacterized Zn finger protein (UPF0148 family)